MMGREVLCVGTGNLWEGFESSKDGKAPRV